MVPGTLRARAELGQPGRGVKGPGIRVVEGVPCRLAAMQRLGLLAPFALALGLSAAVPKESPAESAPSSSSESPASAPRLALLLTPPEGEETSLVFQAPGEQPLDEIVATLRHLRGASVKGALLPGTETVVVVADMESRRDPSWGAALLRLEAGREPLLLADRVYTSTRPLVLDDGRVLVQRGRPGAEPTDADRLRVDEITIDAIDPASGEAQVLHAFSGYIAFLAGALDREAFVYRVGPESADIIAIDVDSGQTRPLAPSVLPFARDFSVDAEGRALVFTERDERSSQVWVVDRIDLQTTARTRLVRGSRMALAPHAWPGGALAFNPDGEKGLTLLLPTGRFQTLRPLGDGVDLVRGFSPDARFAALAHTRPGELPVPFVLSLPTGQSLPVSFPEEMRVDIAGVLQ